MQVLNCYVYPVLLYGMMRIPWTDKVRNEEVLKRAGTGMKLILEIRTKQMRFLGHLMRKMVWRIWH